MLNETYLHEVAGGDPEFIAEILSDFLAQTPELIAQIEAAARVGHPDALSRAAHTLKGSARSVGADEFAEIAFQLELAGKQGDLANAPDTLQRLKAYWDQLADCLQQRTA
ncbi:MAG: Hpt domain-containing protein [Fimbriimonadales bacterium]|nr:Hpt domain-containing protein [Fimbriimonadales bacterium]